MELSVNSSQTLIDEIASPGSGGFLTWFQVCSLPRSKR